MTENESVDVAEVLKTPKEWLEIYGKDWLLTSDGFRVYVTMKKSESIAITRAEFLLCWGKCTTSAPEMSLRDELALSCPDSIVELVTMDYGFTVDDLMSLCHSAGLSDSDSKINNTINAVAVIQYKYADAMLAVRSMN